MWSVHGCPGLRARGSAGGHMAPSSLKLDLKICMNHSSVVGEVHLAEKLFPWGKKWAKCFCMSEF